MSWHFLQEREAASWEGSCLDGAPSALLRLMPTAAACCSLDKGTECLTDSRSGTTCGHSTGSHGAEQLMLCQADSHAKTSALPEVGGGSTENAAGCGWKWPGSFARLVRGSSSWRTRQCSLLGDSEEYSETWPEWGLMRDGECSALTQLARHSTEHESGYWQTPTTRDGKGQCGKGNRKKRGKNGRLHVANLCDQIVDCGRPDLVRSIEFRYSLMGWPSGWTDCAPLATDKFLRWLQMHGEF